jgi:hypothetical protein
VTGILGQPSAALAAAERFTCLVDLTVVSVAIPYLFSACAQLTFLVSGRRPVRGWLLARDLLVAERLQQGPQQRGRALGCIDGHVGSMQEFRWRLIAAHRDPCRADPAGGQLVEGAKRRQVAGVVTEIACGADGGGRRRPG